MIPSEIRDTTSASSVLVDLVVGHDIGKEYSARIDAMHDAVSVVDACLVVVLLRLDGLDAHARRDLSFHDRERHAVR